MGKEIKKAVAYLRTSSRANVGADKDSDKRQRGAIEAYAKTSGYEIVETFYDAVVSGADPVASAPASRRCWVGAISLVLKLKSAMAVKSRFFEGGSAEAPASAGTSAGRQFIVAAYRA